jgi:DNA mismatch repair protein MutS2
VPELRIDADATRLAMGLAFASGVSGGLFAEALDHMRLAPSTFSPPAFERDLFVSACVERCFKVRLGASEAVLSTRHLARLLTHPPADPAIVHHRRAVLHELVESPALRRSVEELYATLCRFRGMLEGATNSGKWDANRRQLDILSVVKELFDRMARDFADARSGLAQLAAFGLRVQAGEPYRSMTELLAYDENMATLDLRVGIGADGKIRGFRIVSVEQRGDNPFVASPLRRFLAKLELFVRGYSFGDGEVMARLIDAVFVGIEEELPPLVQLLGDLELYLGALGFRDMALAAGLSASLPALVAESEPRTIVGLYNPLLLATGSKVVPCDIRLDRHDATVLVTGPNSGGKTRLLQSLGLSQLFAQCGLFVPAASAALALAPSLVVSLIQETRADQAEGRLGMELLRIRELFEDLAPGSMVILDELCSGTNPSEGEEIFELVIRMLTRLRPQTFITTHFLAFAQRLEAQRDIDALRFLQVELGQGQKPTYQFVVGVAKTSLAGQAAERLGVTGAQLTSLVERSLARAAHRAAPIATPSPAATSASADSTAVH